MNSFIEVFDSSCTIKIMPTLVWMAKCMHSGKKCIVDFNCLAVGMTSHWQILQLQIKLVQLIQCYQEIKLKRYLFLVKRIISITIISNMSPKLFASKFQILEKICVYWISSFYLETQCNWMSFLESWHNDISWVEIPLFLIWEVPPLAMAWLKYTHPVCLRVLEIVHYF